MVHTTTVIVRGSRLAGPEKVDREDHIEWQVGVLCLWERSAKGCQGDGGTRGVAHGDLTRSTKKRTFPLDSAATMAFFLSP